MKKDNSAEKIVPKQSYFTPDEVINLVYTTEDGKRLVSKSSFIALCREGKIPCVTLGMKRRVFIPLSYVESALAAAQTT